ncbi:MAG: type II secretion system F family protein [Lacipirellulaceae bacterium]
MPTAANPRNAALAIEGAPSAGVAALLQSFGADPQTQQAGARPSWLPKRFSPRDRVHFTSQLAMMTGAGVSVAVALQSLHKQCQRADLARLLAQTHDDVSNGSTLSAALRKHPELFDEAFTATVAAGEASGKMADVLAQLAEIQRADLRLSRTLRGMLVYPVLLTCVSTAVIGTLVVFVLPRFASIFEQYQLTLPTVTRLLLGVAGEVWVRWWLWGALAAAAVAGAVAARVTPAGRRMVDTALLRTPGLKNVVRTLIGARVCRLLGLLITSGVPLLDCLRLLRKAESNTLFQDLAVELEDAVMNGRSLSDALDGNNVLPASATEMMATAEKTGRLGEVAAMMGGHYEEEGQAAARQLVSVIEPIVTIVMGGVVAVVVLAVMLPVFDIATLAQQH